MLAMCAIVCMMCGAMRGPEEEPKLTMLSRVPTIRDYRLYPANQIPLAEQPMAKLPIGSFKPAGWLRKFLELQRDGLTGHLGEISIWLTKEDNAWLRADGKGKYGWEEVPYWLRGYSRIGYVLNDEAMTRESMIWIEAVLKGQRKDGDFGPIQMKNGKRDLWAQMLMLQVLQSYYEHSKDDRVVPFMTRYFKWQLSIPDADFLKDYWENSRGGDNLASVYWLYNLANEPFLLELATKINRNTANWRKDEPPNWHGVNIAECFREPATYWLQSYQKDDITASANIFAAVRGRYGQVPGGMFAADENARAGYTDPHQATELCAFVEELQSNRIMAEITGWPYWAANSENVAFNSMPAAFMPDYRSLRYLTAPNQVVSDAANHAPGIENSGPFMLMNPFSSRCCQHNHSSAWVNYVEHCWMATSDGGLAAELYASGEVSAKLNGKAATLVEETRYPFEERIMVTVKRGTGEAFPIYLRVPGWATGAALMINEKPLEEVQPGGYARISGEWKDGDVIELTLPMHTVLREWRENKNGVSAEYGPLAFSLKIAEKYQQVESDKTAMDDSGWQPTADPRKWPSFEIVPESAWNYAIVPSGPSLAEPLRVDRGEWPKDDQPFTNAGSPIRLKVWARQLKSWKLDEHGLAGSLPLSPVETLEPMTELTLVPMGGARLRISVFPVVGSKP
jgi:hypothetical protein